MIDVEACKGCDLCIDACPPRVLEMTVHDVNTRGYRYPRSRRAAPGARRARRSAPTSCFQVYKYDTPLEITVAKASDRMTATAPAPRPAGRLRGDRRRR